MSGAAAIPRTRLSVRAIPVLAVGRALGVLATAALAVAIGSGFSLQSAGMALVLSAGAGLAAGLWDWRSTLYWVEDGTLYVRRGVVTESLRAIPLERIRAVDRDVPAMHRLLGLVRVRVDAAAGDAGSEEMLLDGVDRREAEALQTLLLSGAAATTGVEQAAEPPRSCAWRRAGTCSRRSPAPAWWPRSPRPRPSPARSRSRSSTT